MISDFGNTKKPNIRKSILLPFSITFFLLLIIFFIVITQFQWQRLEEKTQTVIEGAQLELYDAIDQQITLLNSQLYFISNLPCTQQAWKAKNKDQLLHCNEAIAEELVQQFNIIEFDYYSSDKIRFLQVIEETSDDHHNQKQTLKRSFNTGEFSAGLLLSQDGDIELNAVHPWVIDDSIVGYIELTSTVTHLLEQLTVTYPLDVLLLLAKENLNNDAWVQRRDGLGEEWDWDQFNLVVVSYGDNILASGNFMDHLKSGLDQKPLHYIKTIVDGTPYTLGMVPLLGESGTTIGNIVLLLDVSSSDEKMNSALFIYIFALVFSGLILLWLFDSKLGRVEIKVAQWGKDLEHEIVERQ